MAKAKQYAIAEAEVRTKRDKGMISANDSQTKRGEEKQKGGTANGKTPRNFRSGKRFKPAFGFGNIDNIMQVEQSQGQAQTNPSKRQDWCQVSRNRELVGWGSSAPTTSPPDTLLWSANSSKCSLRP